MKRTRSLISGVVIDNIQKKKCKYEEECDDEDNEFSSNSENRVLLFNKLSIYLVTPGLGKVQIDIFKSKIIAKGGEVITSLSLKPLQAIIKNGRKIIIVSQLPYEKTQAEIKKNATSEKEQQALLRWIQTERIDLLKPTWLADTLRYGKIQPYSEYIITQDCELTSSSLKRNTTSMNAANSTTSKQLKRSTTGSSLSFTIEPGQSISDFIAKSQALYKASQLTSSPHINENQSPESMKPPLLFNNNNNNNSNSMSSSSSSSKQNKGTMKNERSPQSIADLPIISPIRPPTTYLCSPKSPSISFFLNIKTPTLPQTSSGSDSSPSLLNTTSPSATSPSPSSSSFLLNTSSSKESPKDSPFSAFSSFQSLNDFISSSSSDDDNDDDDNDWKKKNNNHHKKNNNQNAVINKQRWEGDSDDDSFLFGRDKESRVGMIGDDCNSSLPIISSDEESNHIARPVKHDNQKKRSDHFASSLDCLSIGSDDDDDDEENKTQKIEIDDGEDDEWLHSLPLSIDEYQFDNHNNNNITSVNNNNNNNNGKYATKIINSNIPNIKLSKEKASKFACENSPHLSFNHNEHLTRFLEKLEEQERNAGERWRSLAYRKAINSLKKCPEKITDAKQMKSLNLLGIGDKIACKIKEILETGSLTRLNSADERTETINLFSQVWGAGPETVKKWYSLGFRSLEDLFRNLNHLNKQQQIGLKYFHEFKERIPREEVKTLQKVVKNVLYTIDKNLKAVTCGSYRRGAKDCGDIDILVTHRKGDDTSGLLKKIIDLLHKYNFISDDLVTIKDQRHPSISTSLSSSSSSSPPESKIQNKYMGVCVLPPPKGSGLHRRIDIQVIPLEEWPFALLYFTGSAHFNRSMRLWARKNNYSLSEKSLVYRFTSPKRAGNSHSPSGEFKGEPLRLSSEKEIFDALKLTYKPPCERNL